MNINWVVKRKEGPIDVLGPDNILTPTEDDGLNDAIFNTAAHIDAKVVMDKHRNIVIIINK